MAINSLKNNKTPGIDQISGDLLKVDAHTSAVILLPLFIRIWQVEVFPRHWKIGVIIIKGPKKRDLKTCNTSNNATEHAKQALL